MEKRILIVDDETEVMEFLGMLLENNGFSVQMTDSCQTAVSLAAQEEFFLVITDIAMPDMDGYEIIDRIHRITPRTRFAVMTGFGYDPQHTLVRIHEDHNCPCLFKPFNTAKVLEAVHKAREEYESGKTDSPACACP